MANLPKGLIFNGIELGNMTVDESHVYLCTKFNDLSYHSPYLYRCVILIQYKHRFVVDIIADSVGYVESFLNSKFGYERTFFDDSIYIFEAAKNKKMCIPVQYYKNGCAQAAIYRISQLHYLYNNDYKNNKPNKIIVHCHNCKNIYEDDGFVIKNCVCKHCGKH